MSPTEQENTIGKIIWQMVDIVVTLKKNMRMTDESPAGIKFRTALSNMRYGACTKADVDFLRSRQISKSPGAASKGRQHATQTEYVWGNIQYVSYI